MKRFFVVLMIALTLLGATIGGIAYAATYLDHVELDEQCDPGWREEARTYAKNTGDVGYSVELNFHYDAWPYYTYWREWLDPGETVTYQAASIEGVDITSSYLWDLDDVPGAEGEIYRVRNFCVDTNFP